MIERFECVSQKLSTPIRDSVLFLYDAGADGIAAGVVLDRVITESGHHPATDTDAGSVEGDGDVSKVRGAAGVIQTRGVIT